jgi:uncharacterized integral membrane protein
MASLTGAILVFAVIVLFSVQNAAPAEVLFLFWRFESSLAIIIFLSVVAGILIGVLFSAGISWKRSRQKRTMQSSQTSDYDDPPTSSSTRL